MPSDADIERAFRSGDGDDDDGLSVSEASSALESLSGKSVGSSTIESACSACGISTSGEMSVSQFKELVRHLEGKGEL